MNFAFARFFFLLVSCAVASAAELNPTAGAEPGAALSSLASDPEWRGLLDRLGAQKTRVARFEERRHFPFRSEPVVLTGDIRIAPGRGISLSYQGAKPYTVIVDDQGVMMRDARGRQRSAPDDSRAQAVTSALFHVLRFDLAELEEDFVASGRRVGDTWSLEFAPRQAGLAGSLGRVTVRGERQELRRIELTRADGQRIEITLTDAREDVIFPSDVLARYFR